MRAAPARRSAYWATRFSRTLDSNTATGTSEGSSLAISASTGPPATATTWRSPAGGVRGEQALRARGVEQVVAQLDAVFDVEPDDAVALGAQRLGGRRADRARGPGDEDHLLHGRTVRALTRQDALRPSRA